MKVLRLVLVLCFALHVISAEACRYTIREIGFSTLSKVNYVIYKVDENTIGFSKQQELNFSKSNIKPYTLNFKHADKTSPIIAYVKKHNLSFPAYILVDKNGRMLTVSEHLKSNILSSPVQQHLLETLPLSYASVILIEGTNKEENKIAYNNIVKACERITNVIPNMPKQVDVGPNVITISNNQFNKEKVLLWSLGINNMPEHPSAFIVYGKGRIMGEQISYDAIEKGNVYKLLSIIGADCECGLDRKWMLGYQIPLNWPEETRQKLSDALGFDVDNPMVLTEMSRILAIENRVPVDPDGITYEPIVVNLDEEFDDVPEIMHDAKQEDKTYEVESQSNKIIVISISVLVILIGLGAFFVMKRR